MKFDLSREIEHVLVLGAGASKDYGLPTWEGLSFLIREKIDKDKENQYKNKKEVLAWMDKIDKEKKYDSIDKCITEESKSKEYRSNGYDIEDEIFLLIKNILNETYKENEDGWINILNRSILDNAGSEHRIAFINYNYDSVLYKNFLNFKYLAQKEREATYNFRLRSLREIKVPTLFPHSYLFSEEEIEHPSFLEVHSSTPKKHNERVINAISCHESYTHIVRKPNLMANIKLYILGLGGGLEINLNKINFENSISEIHVTINDISIKNTVINFLSEEYKISATEIKVYSTCDELVNKCFNYLNKNH